MLHFVEVTLRRGMPRIVPDNEWFDRKWICGIYNANCMNC